MDLERGTASQSDNQDDTEEVGNAQSPLARGEACERSEGRDAQHL